MIFSEKDIDFLVYSKNDILSILEKVCTINGYTVYPWYNSPEELRTTFDYNGGDEDWMVIVHSDIVSVDSYLPWIESMDSCKDPDVYYVGDFIIYVGSH